MSDKQLIPFSKELWETGEYEVIANNEFPVKIYEIGKNDIVYGRIGSIACDWKPDGTTCSNNLFRHDLMLRKKTKNVWYPIFGGGGHSTKEKCVNYYQNDPRGFIKAIEVEI